MEIETLAQLDEVLASGRPLAGLRLQGLDLASREDRLVGLDASGLVVLGGTTTARLSAWLHEHGAIVFPTTTDCPVDPYRAGLYTADELYAGLGDGYENTPDCRAYDWFGDKAAAEDVLATLLRAVHDDSVERSLRHAASVSWFRMRISSDTWTPVPNMPVPERPTVPALGVVVVSSARCRE